MRRVVITGMGAITPLGVGVEHTWKRIVAGACGITSIFDTDTAPGLPSKVAGVVPRGSRADGKWNPDDWLDKAAQSRMAPFTQYAVAAAHEALVSARLHPVPAELARNTGVILGSGIGNLDDVCSSAQRFAAAGHKATHPLFVPRLLINLAAGHISTQHGLRGPVLAPATACTTGLHAIAQAYHLLAYSPRATAPRAILAGASESCLHPLALSGFARARALATSLNDAPARASRPFDAQRAGFVIAEGAAVLLLEDREHALARGAPVVAEVAGSGLSGDAAHMTAPRADGSGARLAMERALLEASELSHHLGRGALDAASVDYINAHATGTPLGDAAENAAIRALVRAAGRTPASLAVSSTKGATGHLLGAAGSLEAVFTALAIRDGLVPPTLNLECAGPVPSPGDGLETEKVGEEHDGEVYDMDYVPHAAKARSVRVALTNSFGFGGTNASLCLIKHAD